MAKANFTDETLRREFKWKTHRCEIILKKRLQLRELIVFGKCFFRKLISKCVSCVEISKTSKFNSTNSTSKLNIEPAINFNYLRAPHQQEQKSEESAHRHTRKLTMMSWFLCDVLLKETFDMKLLNWIRENFKGKLDLLYSL